MDTAPETTDAPSDTSSQARQWASYIGVPSSTGGAPQIYAYWLDSDGGFAFRTHNGLPSPGIPPDSTGDIVAVPASAIMAFSRSIQNRGILDQDFERDSTGTGFTLQDGRIRLFASRSFPVRSTVEILLATVFLFTGGSLLFIILRRLRSEQAARREAIEARSRMIRVREAERTGLAREIHDGPIQNLHALRLQAHTALLTGGETQNQALEDGLRRVSQELRSIMEGLRPPALDRFGFTAALESHAARVGIGRESIDLVVSAEAESALSTSHKDFQLGIFRVVQEAISNAFQHGSHRVHVSVDLRGSAIETRISDDGDGFGRHPVPSSNALIDAGHYGLVGMRERAEVLGGELTFGESRLGGAEVKLRVPVPTAVAAL